MKTYRIETNVMIKEDGVIPPHKLLTISKLYDDIELRQALAPTLLFQMIGEQVGAQFEQALGEAYADANK